MSSNVKDAPVRRRAFALALASAIVFSASAAATGAETLRLFTLGTASIAGNYYAVGRALCRQMNRGDLADLRCSHEPTPGSQYNLIALHRGELDFAFVQSDWQHLAVSGSGPFADEAMQELRSVMALYAEAVTIIARADAEIESVADLAGKIVDLGGPSTARRATNDRVLQEIGMGRAAFAEIAELSGDAAGTEVCAGRVDATFIVVGHPSAALADLFEQCDLRLVPLDGREVRRFLEEERDFEPYTIPGGLYAANPEPVATVSTMATLVTRADMADDLVGHVAGHLIRHYASLSREAPVLGARDLERMRNAGLSAPLHPAAAAVFDAARADGSAGATGN